MPYPVNKTDGTLLVNLQDLTRDTTSTSLTLWGRGMVDYGEDTAENFVHLLENFASPTAPANPIEGQLWWHNFDPGPPARVINKIKVWDGVKWVPVGGANSDPIRPTNPQPGDLWYSMETQSIYFWNGSRWIKAGTPNTGQPTGPGGPTDDDDNDGIPNIDDPDWNPNEPPTYEAPPDPTEGELWWMLPERQLWAYDETATASIPPDAKRDDGRPVPPGWVLVGPIASKQSTTYTSYTTIVNNSVQPPVTANVIKVVVNNQLVAMWSDRAIVLPGPTTDGMPFTTYDPTGGTNLSLRPGLNMNDTLNTYLNGIAINSDLLDGLDSNQFLRRDQGDFPSIDGFLDLGLPEPQPGNIGGRWRRMYANEFYGKDNKPGVDNIDNITFFGKSTATEEAEKAKKWSTPIKIEAQSTGDVEGVWNNVDGSADAIAQLKFTEGGLEVIRESTTELIEEALAAGDGGPRFISAQESTPIIGPNVVIGAETNRVARIYALEFNGVSTRAKYADLAERYAADAVYAPGTLVMIGGDAEVTQTVEANDTRVFGVVSTSPAHLMNNAAGTDETHPPIALTGRVPVRVVGTCRKGDRLVSSQYAGVAMALENLEDAPHPYAIIGRALQDKDTTDEALIEAVVSIK